MVKNINNNNKNGVKGMKKSFFIILFIILSLGIVFSPFKTENMVFASEDINVSSKSALLYDEKSGTVIYEKNGDKRLPIASMTKLASLVVIFEEIEKGMFTEDSVVRVSSFAAETEGSSAFLDEGSEYKVSDLIMSVIIASANDSTVALAEFVAGSEDNFVKMMNKKANELGLENTNFMNSTGLTVIDHYSSARDIAKIYTEICDNKIYKKYSKIWMTQLVHPSGRKTDLVNTNRLVKIYEGCDCGKTGFTNDAGFCLASSATRGGMRLISVVIGAVDSKTRFDETIKLFNYGFNNYENKQVFSRYKEVGETKVVGGLVEKVCVYPENDFVKFLKKGEIFDYKLEVNTNEIKAPKDVGERVGKLYVLDKNNIVVHEDYLVINEEIKALTLADILKKIYKDYN